MATSKQVSKLCSRPCGDMTHINAEDEAAEALVRKECKVEKIEFLDGEGGWYYAHSPCAARSTTTKPSEGRPATAEQVVMKMPGCFLEETEAAAGRTAELMAPKEDQQDGDGLEESWEMVEKADAEIEKPDAEGCAPETPNVFAKVAKLLLRANA